MFYCLFCQIDARISLIICSPDYNKVASHNPPLAAKKMTVTQHFQAMLMKKKKQQKKPAVTMINSQRN